MVDVTVDLSIPIVNPDDGTPTTAFEDVLTQISTTGTEASDGVETLDRQVNYPVRRGVDSLRQDVEALEAQTRRPTPSGAGNTSDIEALSRQMTTQFRALLAPIKQRLEALEAMG